MNSHNFIGNIGNDAEVRNTQTGKQVTQFSVAMTSGWGQNKKTTWVRCSMWGDRGQKLAQYLVKGQRVAITGESYLEEWQAQDGTTKASFACNVDNVTLVGDKGGQKQAPQQQAPQGNSAPAIDDFNSDIPF